MLELLCIYTKVFVFKIWYLFLSIIKFLAIDYKYEGQILIIIWYLYSKNYYKHYANLIAKHIWIDILNECIQINRDWYMKHW